MAKQTKLTPMIKKEEKLMEAIKKQCQIVPEEDKEEITHHPIRISLKGSSESIYKNSEPYLTFHEIEPPRPNQLDLLQQPGLQG